MGMVSTTLNGGVWSYRDGAFYADRAASIARNVGLPDSARIEWDLIWEETMNMAIALYADRLQPVNLQNKESAEPFGGFYSLQLIHAQGVVRLLAITKENSNPDLGTIPFPSLSATNAAHFEVLVSKSRGSIALRIDGMLIHEWRDTNGFIGAGTGMRFVHQGQGKVKLSGFGVSEWNGDSDGTLSAQPESKEDRVKVADGEELKGMILGMGEGTLRFVTANGRPFNAPFESVRLVEFAGTRLDWTPPKNLSARAYFWHGGSIGLVLDEARGDQLKAHGPDFASATFLRSAFKRIEFF